MNIKLRCNICEQLRPWDKISVLSKDETVRGIRITQNIRYCNDNQKCGDEAEQFTFLNLRRGNDVC